MDKKKIKRVLKRALKLIVCLVLIVSMTFCYMYHEPVVAHATGIEAVFAGLAAGTAGAAISPIAGGLIIAAAATALGIGVGAMVKGETYAEACQNIWKHTQANAIMGITIAGTAAKPIINMTRDAVIGVSSAILGAISDTENKSILDTTFGENVALSGDFTASQLSEKLGVPISLYTSSNYTMDTVFTDFKIYRVIKDFDTTGKTILSFSGYQNYSGLIINNSIQYDTSLKMPRAMDAVTQVGTYFSYPSYIVSWTNDTCARYGFLLRASSGSDSYKILNYHASGALPVLPELTLGNDVVNVANEAWFAKEISALNNKIDDLENRLEVAQGNTPGSGLKVYPPAIPAPPSTGSTIWDKNRKQTQSDSLETDPDNVTPADKAKNEATNVGHDTTIPDTDTDDPPSSNPNDPPSSSPDKIVDVTGGFPALVSGVNKLFDDFNKLLALLGDFFKFLAQGFSYLPSQFSVLFVAVIVIALVVRIFGRGGGE